MSRSTVHLHREPEAATPSRHDVPSRVRLETDVAFARLMADTIVARHGVTSPEGRAAVGVLEAAEQAWAVAS